MAASFKAVAGEIPPEAQDPVLSHSPGLVPEARCQAILEGEG